MHTAHVHRCDALPCIRDLLQDRPIRLLIRALYSVGIGEHSADKNEFHLFRGSGADVVDDLQHILFKRIQGHAQSSVVHAERYGDEVGIVSHIGIDDTARGIFRSPVARLPAHRRAEYRSFRTVMCSQTARKHFGERRRVRRAVERQINGIAWIGIVIHRLQTSARRIAARGNTVAESDDIHRFLVLQFLQGIRKFFALIGGYDF